jgi:hypothetical protein
MGASVFFESASELATLANTFAVNGTPTDPTSVSLAVTAPSGTTTTYTYAGGTVAKTGTGAYRKDVACTEAGTWSYVWTGTGPASDAAAGTWDVYDTDLGRLYATVEMLKSRLGITSTTDDAEVYAACFAASRAVEHHCQSLFWRTPTGTARTFTPDDRHLVTLPAFCTLVSVAELATGVGDGEFGTVWSADEYQMLPANPSAAPEPRPYDAVRAVAGRTFPTPGVSRRSDLVRITGVYGWPATPWGVKQAALILAQETFKAKDTFGGVAGFGEFGVVRLRENPMLAAYVAPYMRLDGFA